MPARRSAHLEHGICLQLVGHHQGAQQQRGLAQHLPGRGQGLLPKRCINSGTSARLQEGVKALLR
jgi:hypothetical protein